MKTHYYIPKIEEFHVGFEYETYNGREWVKEIAETCYSDQAYICLPIPEKDYRYDSENTRVKFLDREDIESLGWEFKKHHPGTTFLDFQKGDKYLGFDSDFKGKIYLRIYDGEDQDAEFNFFNGTIKNKSELKKLMKQLNILE